jgi:serine/threonine protein kinase/tetratricopeptide (TPR) repeat protein
MNPDKVHIDSIFLAAAEKATADERVAYLNGACGSDRELRERVERLLAAQSKVHSFLEAPASALVVTVDDPISERPGTTIGPYKLLEQIGEGGFGVVFMAEQMQPVRRKVALKVLKPGMDTRQVVARFEAERQALALMDHPNIAHILDGGETASGRPYFVMELVRGISISEFCDQSHLSVRDRLELFLSVCQAVQHAHQKGIIHRDLKPSNVLVTLHDDKAVVKVIDFGIAKATGQQLTDKTLFTNFAQMIGTPLYMSPEQAQMSGLDVDTRSDIYSLGVLLYELLTGTTPFDKERLRAVGYDEIRRIIREEEPPRPSTRLSTLAQAATTASANRQSDPMRLSQLLRGELDWIVMKALEKDRNRRYESASAFAADVQRYLNDEPVQACPPSGWYRFRKFARRNNAGLATAGLILFFLVFVGCGVGWVAWAQVAKQRETERGATAALAQADLFLTEGDKETDNPARWQATVGLAESAVQRAEELLAVGQATADLAERVRQVREAVNAARTDSRLVAELERIELETAAVKQGNFDQRRAAPRYAAVLRAYGVNPAAPEEAAARVRRSRVREALLSALENWWRVAPDAVERQQLAALLQAAEPEPDAFRSRWRAAVRRRNGATLAQMAGAPGVQGLPAAVVVTLARDLRNVKEYAVAERLLRAGQQRHRGNFWLNHDLGMVLLDQAPPRPEEAVSYLTAALALRSDSPGVYLNLGKALHEKKDLEGAIREFQAALHIDPEYAMAHNNIGIVLRDKKDLEGAIREFQAALKIDPNHAMAHASLGIALADQKDLEGAIREFQAALKIDPGYAKAHYNLGNALHAKKDLEGAIGEFQAALSIDPGYAAAHTHLGNALYGKGQVDEAIACFKKAIELDPKAAGAHINLGNALYGKGKVDEAIACFKKVIGLDLKDAEAHTALGAFLCDRIHDYDGAIVECRKAIALDPKYANAHHNLGTALSAKGQLDAAIAEFREAIRLKKDHAVAHYGLGTALADKGQLDDAITEFREAIRLKKDYPEAHHGLGRALMDKGQLDAAIAEFREAIRLKKDSPHAHCNLGFALRRQGEFRMALEEMRRGHELGSKDPRWPYPSAQWVQQCEREVELDPRLPDFLAGKATPASPDEGIALAELCVNKELNRAAVRFFKEAFAAQPKLADDLDAGHRYNAACAAALAGCGKGKDTDKLDGQARARLRRQALDWLRSDLEACRQRLDKGPDSARSVVVKKIQLWLIDADLGGVRGPEALARLPDSERQPWQELWGRVADTVARSQEKTAQKKLDAK